VAMATDPVFAIFSMTQALVGVCAMQLVEEGKISRSDPAKKYGPEIAGLQVLDGFGPGGQPKTRPPRRGVRQPVRWLPRPHTVARIGLHLDDG